MAEAHAEQMKRRTKAAAVAVIRLTAELPKGVAGRTVSNQIIRSSTSVGANYRAARRARSRKEFVAKLGVVIEEADETLYWIEIAVEAGLLSRESAKAAWREMNEITSILIATIRTAKKAQLARS